MFNPVNSTGIQAAIQLLGPRQLSAGDGLIRLAERILLSVHIGYFSLVTKMKECEILRFGLLFP